jgi:hypothetical protein
MHSPVLLSTVDDKACRLNNKLDKLCRGCQAGAMDALKQRIAAAFAVNSGHAVCRKFQQDAP